jgi:hypothetical protein
MTIGTAANAALAATCPREFYLAEGCTRQAYLIDGVVYKVPAPMFYGDENANAVEFANAERMRGMMPAGFAIPEMTMYGDILAAEFIDGNVTGECMDEWLGIDCTCAPGICIASDLLDPIAKMGITDVGLGNIIELDGIYYLIDVVS